MTARKRGRWPLPKGWCAIPDEVNRMTYQHHSGAEVEWRGGWCWWKAYVRGRKKEVGYARTRAEAFRKAVGR